MRSTASRLRLSLRLIQKKIVPGQVEDGKKLAAAVEGLERAEVMDMVMELEGEMHAAAGGISRRRRS